MNLFLRLLRVIIHAFFRPSVAFMETATLSFTVWPHDLDINLHMTNSRYLSLMDLGRTDLMIRTGLAKKAYKRKWLPVLGSANIRWRKELNVFDKITMETKVLGWDDKWIYMEQRVVSKNIVHAIGLVKGLFVSKTGVVPNAKLIELANPDLKSPRLPKAVKLWIEMEEEMRNRLKDES